MAEYHVSAGVFGIYAGVVNPRRKDGLQTWKSKSEVTDEAICAVRDYLAMEAETKKLTTYGFEWDRKDGKVVELIVRIADKDGDCK